MEAVETKRVRRDPQTTRALILAMTEKLMVEEGYAAVTSRRVAQELGLNGATIHYYYPATDDLFIALHQQMMDRQLNELERVRRAENPLVALWDFQSGWAQSALGVEFLALANHRKNIADVLARVANDTRMAQAQALEHISTLSGIDPAILPPIALITVLIAISRTLANEERVGITLGHSEVRAFVDRVLANIYCR